MRLTDDRRNHLSHRIIERLDRDDLADFPDETAALREAKAVFFAYAKAEEEADAFARNTIAKLSRRVPEGGREWDILYRKYFEEELARRKL